MPLIKSLLLLIVLLQLSGCTGRSSYQLLQTSQPIHLQKLSAASMEYKILPQDRLKVILYKDPAQIGMEQPTKLGDDINPGGILVNAKGYIRLPLIGKIKVSHLTQTQAAEKIERAYRKYLTDPSVYVEIMNKRIIVLGEVYRQGAIALDKEKMTLFEALGFAGGLRDDAVRDSIIILSHSAKKGLVMRQVDLTNFDTMHYASLMLRPNDVVYVKANKWKEFKVNAGNYTAPFSTISKIAAPFVTLKYLNK